MTIAFETDVRISFFFLFNSIFLIYIGIIMIRVHKRSHVLSFYRETHVVLLQRMCVHARLGFYSDGTPHQRNLIEPYRTLWGNRVQPQGTLGNLGEPWGTLQNLRELCGTLPNLMGSKGGGFGSIGGPPPISRGFLYVFNL